VPSPRSARPSRSASSIPRPAATTCCGLPSNRSAEHLTAAALTAIGRVRTTADRATVTRSSDLGHAEGHAAPFTRTATLTTPPRATLRIAGPLGNAASQSFSLLLERAGWTCPGLPWSSEFGMLVPMSIAACDRFEAQLRLPSPLERLDDDRLRESGVKVWLKRDDLIHADVPGNKWRKLHLNLAEAARAGEHTLLTFGGAYSNHIRATAAAGYYCGFGTIGIIRGEEHQPLNPSLSFAVRHGMRLCYLSRTDYRRKNDPEVIAALRREFGRFCLLPEGGSNALAARGCTDIPAEIEMDFDLICCPVGTGGTLAGIAAGLAERQHAIGFSVLKGAGFLEREVRDLQQAASGNRSGSWHIEHGFHFGGFARRNAELDAFIADFADRHGIVLDWAYVAKMLFGVFSLAQHGVFSPGSKVVAVITGRPFPD
jgi:1-aminocyclopropane-1-carboxylate deaminase